MGQGILPEILLIGSVQPSYWGRRSDGSTSQRDNLTKKIVDATLE